MKATHKGHCQVCGAEQKLPGGVLSQHGYTVRWGFFSGVCRGAGNLPFEQDISLIQGMIEWAEEEASRLRATAQAERTQNNPDDVWYHAYFSGMSKGESGYRWIKTRIYTSTTNKYRICYQHPGDNRPVREEDVYSGLSHVLTQCAQQLNAKHADHLEREAEQRDKYALWQAERIKDWKPSALIPI